MSMLRILCIALVTLSAACVKGSDDASGLSEADRPRSAANDGDSDGSAGAASDSGDTKVPSGVNDPGDPLCNETCAFTDDGECDDGGPDSTYADCALGSDCADCGRRTQADLDALSDRGDADGDMASGDGDGDGNGDGNGDGDGNGCTGEWPLYCGDVSCDASECLEIMATRGEAVICGGNPDSTELSITNTCDYDIQLDVCFVLTDGTGDCTARTFAAGEADDYPGHSGFVACDTGGEYRFVAIREDSEDACILGSRP